MGEPIPNISRHGEAIDSNALILSSFDTNALANLPPDAELTAVRQMMETLFAKMDALQQNQAIQLAGVHDRLDAVELELPMIQEQGALRIRDLEARMSLEIEEASRAAVEEATVAAQEEIAGKFKSVSAQMEAQREELTQIRESKKLAETRLDRAILDIERLCGNLAPHSDEEPHRIYAEPPSSPFRSRIAEHIRKAAVDLAPGEDNPLIGDAHFKRFRADFVPITQPPAAKSVGGPGIAATPKSPDLPQPVNSPVSGLGRVAGVAMDSKRAVSPFVAAAVSPSAAFRTAAVGNSSPGFDAWKRQFMQDGEPPQPVLSANSVSAAGAVVCPRCFSDRTRPATLNRLDRVLRLAGYFPYRCRSCADRFYKRGAPAIIEAEDESAETRTSEAMEAQ